MSKKYNISGFYLCLVCLMFTLLLFYTTSTQRWVVAPPSYFLWFLSIIAFFLGYLGLKDKTNWISKWRSRYTITVSLMLSFVLFIGVLRLFFYSEELMFTTHSPDGQHTINFYLTNGGATTAYGVLGKLEGPLWFEKTIYDDYRMDRANVKWINNDKISINKHLLDLKKGETYSD
ncbi:DUF5412 family protein [Fictibacillus barbaricus]|uniref:DUF5673 domain-containing protein n=1 Tax=Fictibacillus barbaricus TaxID=182136 RepID=A0ABU1TWU3_9BACL|nr:DUF5412 family protein [Fictibacillus barbaricus]MDR7071686.1 hypothetical protein [Fictibacillus barbaricus]